VHVGPTITAGGTVTYATGGTAAVLDATVAVSDPDSTGLLTRGTVAVTAGTFGGDGDILSAITTGTSISVSYNAATEILTLNGTDTLANYQAVLRSVAFHSSASDPTNDGGNPNRTISWTIGDGVSIAATGTSTLDVTRLPPVISGTSGGRTTTDEATVDPFAAVSVADPNSSQTETVTISLSNAANGTLSNLGGGTFNSGTGVYSVVGTDAAVTTALDGLVFTPTAHQVAPGSSVTTSFAIQVANTAGAVSSDTTTTVIATAANDPPVIAGAAGGQTTTDEATKTPFSGLSISDVDFGQTETVTVTLSNHLNGTLSTLGGGSFNSGTGVYSITGADAAVTTAVDGLVFTPTAHQVAPGGSVTTTFTIHATDTAGGISSNATTTVIATAANDPPVIAGAIAGQTTTDEATKTPFSGVSISDVDFGQTETVTVTLSNHLNGTLSTLGGGSFDSGTGVYSITGADAAVTTAVDGLVFTPTAHQVAPGGSVTTTFTITVTDTAGGTSSNATTTVAATAANDTPIISGAIADQTTTDEATLTPLSGVSISDVDFGQTETMTVTLSDHLNGTLSNQGSGSFNNGTGVYSVTGNDAALSTALDGLVFTPTPHQVAPGSSISTTFTIHVTDTAGATASDSTTTVIAIAANDPPVIAGTAPGHAVNDNATDQPFSAATISDPDVSATENVTITLTAGGVASDANGALSGSGLTHTGTGIYTLATDTPAAVTAALQALVFTPIAHEVPPGGTVTTGMTLSVSDGIAGTPTTDATTTVIATAANDPPVIAGAIGGQTTTDHATATPFASVGISDVDAGQTETVTVTLSSVANGTLSNLGTGSYDATTGIYAVIGSDSQVTAAVDELVFTPAAHQVAPGGSVTTTFTINTTDTAGETTSNSTTTVIATAINDPPTITNVMLNAGVPNQVAAAPFAGMTISDPDIGHTDVVTVTLSDPAGGTLSNLGSGSFDATTGVFTVSGTPATVTAVLQALAFASAPPVTGGFVRTTSFTVAVTSPGGSASNSSISVTSTQQVLGLAGTPTGNDVVSVSPDGSSFAAPITGMVNQAAVSAPSQGATYTLPTGYQAEFLGGSADASLTDPSGGNALLVGNSGNDTITSGANNDTILGGTGNNTLSVSGANAVINANGTSTVSAAGAHDTVFGGSGNLTATDSGTADAIGLGTGTSTVTLSGSGSSLFANVGSASIVATGTGNAIGLYTGNANVSVGGSGNRVFAGSGSATIVSNGTGIAIGLSTGAATLTVSGADSGVYGNSGAMSVNVTGSADTIFGGSGRINATLGGSNDVAGASTSVTNLIVTGSGATVFGNATGSQLAGDFEGSNAVIGLFTGSANLTLGGGNAQVFGNAGTTNIVATGAGNDAIHLYTGASSITAGGTTNLLVSGNPAGALDFIGGAGSSTILGAGGTTMFGGSGGTITYIGQVGAAASFTAGAGNETLNAALSAGAVSGNGATIGGGADVLVGGAGGDTLTAGAGITAMTGGAGANLFEFSHVVGGGTATVTDFNAADTVVLAGYGAAAAGNALSGATFSGGATTITLSDNTRITFANVPSVAGLTGHVLST
jgi:plastocyanin